MSYAGFLLLSGFNVRRHPVFLGARFWAYSDAPKIPKLVTPLTDMQVTNAKPKDKAYKLFDGGGLYLEA